MSVNRNEFPEQEPIHEFIEDPVAAPHLTDYYYLLRKRLWLILSCLGVAILIAALHTFSEKPVYKATASIIIGNASRSPLTGQPLYANSYMGQELTFNTHFELITSRPVLEKVLAQIDLNANPPQPSLYQKTVGTFKANLHRLLSAVFPASSAAARHHVSSKQAQLAGEVDYLASMIHIEAVPDTRLLNIQVVNRNPETARDIANTLANTYILYDASSRLESSRKMMDWLSKQLYTMKKKVEDAERQLLAFQQRENLFSVQGVQKMNVQKIQEMNSDYISARMKYMEEQAKIKQLQKFIGEDASHVKAVPAFLNNGLLNSLYSDLLNTEVEYSNLATVYRAKHPKMIAITSKINELRSKIRDQLQKALANAQAESAILQARQQALQQAIHSYETEAIDTNRKEVQYTILQREVQTNKDLYNTLLTKIKQADITDTITRSNLRLVAPAVLPTTPIGPRKTRTLFLGALLGLALGIGLAFFLEYLDQTLHNTEEVTRYLDLPVFAEIPLEKIETKSKGKDKSAREPLPMLLDIPGNHHFPEAFRRLATNLRFSALNTPRSTYLVTSSRPREGKSTLALNLGLTMAQLGLKTLLVEADLRLPSLRKNLGLPGKEGLTDVLVDTLSTEIHSGPLDVYTIADLHKLLQVQEKTGTLHYRNHQDRFTVSFFKGDIIDVDWPTRPEQRRLGQRLVQSGKLTPEQIRIALEEQEVNPLKLGQILLNLGFISVEELAGTMHMHALENLQALYRCQHDTYTFEEHAATRRLYTDPKEAALIKAMGTIETSAQNDTPYLLEQIRSRTCQVRDQNLWVLPCGKQPPNPGELLASTRMRVLLDLLRRHYDLVLIDSPPVTSVSDTSVLAPLADGVLLLVRAGFTDYKVIHRAREQLKTVHAPLVGVVLNMLDFKKDPYYYYRYYSKYEEYYGDE